MNYFFSTLSLLAAAFSVFVGCWVLVKNSKPLLNRIFLLICLSVGYWGYSESQLRQAGSYDSAFFWLKFGSFWLIPMALVLHFVLVFTEQRRLLNQRLTYVFLYVPAFTLSLVDLTTEQITGAPVERWWGWSFDTPPTFLSYLATLLLAGLGSLTVFFCWRFYLKQHDRLAKKRALFVTLGFTIPIITGLANEVTIAMPTTSVPEFAVIIFATLGLGLIAYAIRKYQLLDVNPAFAADTIVSTMADAIFIVSPHGDIMYSNDAALEMLGYSQDQLLGQSCLSITSDEKSHLYSFDFEFEDIRDQETSFITKEGKMIPVSLSGSVLPGRRGGTEGRLLIARDISSRKRREAEIIHQREELAARNEAISALYDITSAFSQELELNRLLPQALEMIIGLGLFGVLKRGGIFLLEGDELKLAAQYGHDEELVAAHKDFHIEADCLCPIAARTGEVIVSTDCQKDPRHCLFYCGSEPHGHVIVPLKTADFIFGVLYLFLPPGQKPGAGKLKLLKAIGNQIGMSIRRARLYEETRSLSLHDSLTGLANRNLMNDELEKTFARSRRTGTPCSLIMLDLDRFKDFNDDLGHAAGDLLLKDLANILLEETREMDSAARYGGEEFLIILPDSRSRDAVDAAERIRRRVESILFVYREEAPPAKITVSLGVATYEPGLANYDELLARADASLYRAKQKGRNRIEVWTNTSRSPGKTD